MFPQAKLTQLWVSNDKIIRHVRIRLQNHGPAREGPNMAVCCRNDNRRGGSPFCDGGGSQVSGAKAGWNFHLDIEGGQKSSGGLNKAVTAENKSTVEFG